MFSGTQDSVALLLPGRSNLGRSSYRQLRDLIDAKTSVEASLVFESDPGEPQQLCARFDPADVSLQILREFAQRAGFILQTNYDHHMTNVAAMSARQAQRRALELSAVPGVLEAVVSPDGGVRVEFDRDYVCETTLHSKLNKMVGSHLEPNTGEHAKDVAYRRKPELAFVGLCGVTLLTSWFVPTYFDAPELIAYPLRLMPYFFGGWLTLREAVGNARAGRIGIDTLMLLAAVGLGFLGKWTEGGLLLFLFSLGNALESYAAGRTKRAFEALADLLPTTAQRIVGQRIEMVPVDALSVADRVLVKPNARVPVDGIVIKGQSNVNEALITGFSDPVAKHAVSDIEQAVANVQAVDASSRVYAGTQNGNRGLHVYVTCISTESTFARVVNMVHEGRTDHSQAHRFAERLERLFIPVILLAAASVLLFGFIVDLEMSTSVYRMLALIVAASPCALAIATPSAILSAITRAVVGGVLIKGGESLIRLSRLRTIVFGNAGVFTEGNYRVVEVERTRGISESELLQVAIAAASSSDPAVATAIAGYRAARRIDAAAMRATDRQDVAGGGIDVLAHGENTVIGRREHFSDGKESAIPFSFVQKVKRLESLGCKVLLVRRDSRVLGVVGLMNETRPAATAVIRWLRKLGIRRLLIIAGGRRAVGDAIVRDVGFDEAYCERPDDKVQLIKRLRAETPVAMVDDAISNARAMANATVSVAIGAAANRSALENSDIAVMADDLRPLLLTVGLSRASGRVIRQNLCLSIVIVAVLVPATLAGLSIGTTVLLHEIVTALVIVNSLRLLTYRPPAISDSAEESSAGQRRG